MLISMDCRTCRAICIAVNELTSWEDEVEEPEWEW